MTGTIRLAMGLLLGTLRDIAPILVIIAFFQIAVLQQPVDNLGEIAVGFVFVMLGLAAATFTLVSLANRRRIGATRSG